ncbi:MAG: VWA domain-containing protein [bacterium]|nr:VWA domain-containing protein [bacterium]
MPRQPIRTPGLLALGILLCVTSAAAKDRFEAARAYYEERVQRPSLYKRTQGREVLAKLRDPRVIEILAKDYGSAEDPSEQVRETIVEMTLRRPWRGEAVDKIASWRESELDAHDAWLWYRSLRHEVRNEDVERAEHAAQSQSDAWIQESALRALSAGGHDEVLALIPARLDRLLGDPKPQKKKRRGLRPLRNRRGKAPPPPPFDQKAALAALRLENTARVLLDLKSHHAEEAWKSAAMAMLAYYDARKTTDHTRTVMARCLANALDVAMAELNREQWVREVMAGGSGAGASDDRYPSFAGLEAHGKRIVYVIDFSDSMTTPLKTKERAPVITGADKDESDGLPWDRIHTRFDLARELLKQSLEGLPHDKLFAVVWFGDHAGTLEATKKFVISTPENVRKTIRELDAIRPGAPGSGTTQFQHGALRGETNLHGGMRLAFRLSEDGDLGDDSFVSPIALMRGVESMFVFSDGVPTTDNFVTRDKRDNEGAVTDRETNKPAALVPELMFPGPYAYPRRPYLLDDLRRYCLFRTVQIHCVGIGKADMRLLGKVAKIGDGEARRLGEDTK